MQKITYPTITLPDGDKRFRDIEISENGDLIFSQADSGPATAKIAPNGGDSDYEYSTTVSKEHLDKILLTLIREKFEDHGEFDNWLKQHKIPSTFWSY